MLQAITIDRDETHDNRRPPEIIKSSGLPQHRLTKYYAKYPQEQIDQDINRCIISLLMFHIPIDQKREQDKDHRIGHVKDHFVHS